MYIPIEYLFVSVKFNPSIYHITTFSMEASILASIFLLSTHLSIYLLIYPSIYPSNNYLLKGIHAIIGLNPDLHEPPDDLIVFGELVSRG